MAQALVGGTGRIGAWTEKTRRDLVASHDFRDVVRSLGIFWSQACSILLSLLQGRDAWSKRKKKDTARSGWDHFLRYSDWLMGCRGPEDLLIRVLHAYTCTVSYQPVSTKFTLPCRLNFRVFMG